MKPTAGVLGFIMLFAVPTEVTGRAIGVWAVRIAAAILLLAYAGAFKRTSSTYKTSKP